MKPNTIYSKSGKGVQEASGKTSLLKRTDRAVLSAIDGRATLAEVAQKVGKSFDGPFQQLIAQLDKDGFVREVTAASSSTTVTTMKAAPAAKPSAPKPAAKAAEGGGVDLDFTSIMPAVKRGAAPPPPAPKPAQPDAAAQQRAKEQEAALYKARQEAEARAQAERDKLRQEAEAKARAEAEAKIRAETEKKLREEAEGKAKAEAAAKARAAEEAAQQAREAAQRAAAEAKAKAEAEANARIEAERKAREEAERRMREEAERIAAEARAKAEAEARAKIEAERKAREEAERKAREEAEKARREADELRQRLEEERKAREAEERRLREELEAKAREAAEQVRRAEEQRLRVEQEAARARQARDMEEARARAAQRQRQDEERARKAEQETRTHEKLPAVEAEPRPDTGATFGTGSLDALMADLDSFSQREDEERQAREAAALRERAEKQRLAQELAERRAREQAEREEHERQRAAEEARRREEEDRRAQEEAERRLREAEEQRRLEAEERQRRAREAQPGKPAALPEIDELNVTEADLGMDDVRRDEAAVARETRKAQRERERQARKAQQEARERAEAAAREQPVKYPKARRPVKWGRPVAMALFVLLVAGIAALHIVPLPMQKYEDAASEALGRPVKIGSGRLSLLTGVRLDLHNVSVGGDVRIGSVHAYPRIGSLVDEKKAFRRIELDGVTLPQAVIGDAFASKMRVEGFDVGRLIVRNLKLDGPVTLPAFEADAVVGPDGALRSVTLRGPDSLNARLTPAANGEVEFDVTAASVAVPFAPELTLSSFAMKGTANRQGMNVPSWGGSTLDGVLSGTARVRWGGSWQVDGVVMFRNINAAIFAPTLLSEGKAEGSGRFSMVGAHPAKLYSAARMEGSFTLGKGALGTVDLSRVLQTSGKQYGGRTVFTELTGQGVYERGAVSLRNVSLSAGALHAAASADISANGALAGRIVADIRTNVQPLRAVVTLSGTVKEPQVRN